MSDLSVTSAVSLLAYTLTGGASSDDAANPYETASEGETLANIVGESTGATYGTLFGTLSSAYTGTTDFSLAQAESSLSESSLLAQTVVSGSAAQTSSSSLGANSFAIGAYQSAASTAIPSVVTYSLSA